MTGKPERAAIADWAATTGAGRKNLAQSLATLPVGEAHPFSPQWLVVSEQVKIAKKRSPDVSMPSCAGARSTFGPYSSPFSVQNSRPRAKPLSLETGGPTKAH